VLVVSNILLSTSKISENLLERRVIAKMAVERKLSEYIKGNGIKITFISERTGIDYQILCRCLNEKQPLKADEFLAVCKVLEVDPKDFLNE